MAKVLLLDYSEGDACWMEILLSQEHEVHLVVGAELTEESINLIIPSDDDTENIYITGGFSNNPLFLKLIAEAYPTKKVYTSEIPNATALGAALVILSSIHPDRKYEPDLGLNLIQ